MSCQECLLRLGLGSALVPAHACRAYSGAACAPAAFSLQISFNKEAYHLSNPSVHVSCTAMLQSRTIPCCPTLQILAQLLAASPGLYILGHRLTTAVQAGRNQLDLLARQDNLTFTGELVVTRLLSLTDCSKQAKCFACMI